jgi:hypothetical protein
VPLSFFQVPPIDRLSQHRGRSKFSFPPVPPKSNQPNSKLFHFLYFFREDDRGERKKRKKVSIIDYFLIPLHFFLFFLLLLGIIFLFCRVSAVGLPSAASGISNSEFYYVTRAQTFLFFFFSSPSAAAVRYSNHLNKSPPRHIAPPSRA